MEFSVRSAELRSLLENQISNFVTSFQSVEWSSLEMARAKNPVHSYSLLWLELSYWLCKVREVGWDHDRLKGK